MARLARIVILELPHHVTQRGNKVIRFTKMAFPLVTVTGIFAPYVAKKGDEKRSNSVTVTVILAGAKSINSVTVTVI